MPSITDSFVALSEAILAEYHRETRSGASRPHATSRQMFIDRCLRPLMPSSVRLGPGMIIDLRDRAVGPFDLVACSDLFPPFGDGATTTYLSDGVIFACQLRDWTTEPLSDFAKWAERVKTLDRDAQQPVLCAAVSFAPIPLQELEDFLKGPEGKSLDLVLCLGDHLIVRNDRGLYGDPSRIPFVTQRDAGLAFKGFAMLALQLTQSFLGQPFRLAKYQHL